MAQATTEGETTGAPLEAFEEALGKLADLIEPFATMKRRHGPVAEPWEELTSRQAILTSDIEAFAAETTKKTAAWAAAARDIAGLNAARTTQHPMAERCRDLTKEIDLAAKLASRVIDICLKELEARDSNIWTNAELSRARRALEAARGEAVDALRRTRYFVRQADWLQERFPDATLRDVEGLVKLFDRAEIAAHAGSLTPGRYVGVAPEEQDEDFSREGRFIEPDAALGAMRNNGKSPKPGRVKSAPGRPINARRRGCRWHPPDRLVPGLPPPDRARGSRKTAS